MRFQGKTRLGFYPLPLQEAERIRSFLWFPDAASSAIDPRVGDGVAFEVVTSAAAVLRYGIELDVYRAEQAMERIPNIVQGNTLEVQCPVECFGLLYLNPPYDWTLGQADSHRTEQMFLSHTYRWLPSEPEAQYNVPVSGPAQLVYRGLPRDEIEDLLPQSAAYRQAGRILFAEPVSAIGRPLTPLHAGHVGLLACSGLLNGIFGSGDERHIAFWQAVKIVDKTEEEDEQGIVTVREKERCSNELTVVYSTGQVAMLK